MTIEEINRLDKAKCHKFSVFARDKLPMPGEKRFIGDVLNRELLITDFQITGSKKRNGTQCMRMQFVLDGKICVLFTGSSVLIDQIQASRDNIPFCATIVKIDKYYSFS